MSSSGLHPSLNELGAQAPRCTSVAQARGVLAECQDLLRNALAHGEDVLALAAWYSRLVIDVVTSPAIASPVRLTGAIARGDGIPSLAIEYLGSDDTVAALCESVGLPHRSVPETTASRVDSGLAVGNGGEAELFAAAQAARPPALQLVEGLPDRYADVDISEFLLAPIAAIARWAAPAPRPTPDRLAIGAERELLTHDQAQALTMAWETGMRLELRHWVEHIDREDLVVADLAPIERTAYGSACWAVSSILNHLSQEEV